MAELKIPSNLLLPEDPPLESVVESLTVSLDEIKKEKDLLDYAGVEEPQPYRIGRLGVAEPTDVKLDDFKTDIPLAYTIGKPGYSKWNEPGVSSSTKVKKEVFEEECSSSSSRLMNKVKSEPPEIKEEISSSEEDSNLSLQEGENSLDMEGMSSKSKLNDIEIKTEEELKQEELMLNDSEASSDTTVMPRTFTNLRGKIDVVRNGLRNKSSEECQKNLSRKDSIQTHHKQNKPINWHTKIKHTIDEIKKYQCAQCKYNAHKKYSLARHIKLKHQFEIFQSTLRQYQTKNKYELKSHGKYKHTSGDEIEVFHCMACEYKTRSKGCFNFHVIRRHKSIDEVEIFQCTFCEYKAKMKADLNSHVKNKHTNTDTFFDCTICDYKTKYKKNLTRHIVMKHKSDDKVEIFHCMFCDYKTKYIWNIRSHIVVKHKSDDEVEMFRCTFCEYKTKYKRNLSQHIMLKHKSDDEVEIFYCSFCDYKTRSKPYFNSHLIRRHKII